MIYKKRDLSGAEVALGCLLLLLPVPAVIALQAWLLKWAWQLVLVPVFGLTPITMWQSVAVCVILSIVGSAFRSSSGSKS